MEDVLQIEKVTRDLHGRKHSVELQSIRGLAAFVVMLAHCTFYFDYNPAVKMALEYIFNAHASIIIFFVLSGFVLTLSFSKKSLGFAGIAGYYVRRGFRLYPALWVGALVAISYPALFHGYPLPRSVAQWWWAPQNRELPAGIFGYFTLFGGVRTTAPIPIWTLFIEIVGSITVPVLALLARRWLPLFLVVLLASLILPFTGLHLLQLAAYFCSFVVGVGLTRLIPAFEKWFASNWAAGVATVLAVLLLWQGRHFFVSDYRGHYNAPWPILVESLAAAVLVGLVWVRPERFPLLRTGIAAWLGDISYSLYLLHLPIIGFVAWIGVEGLQLPVFTRDPLVATLALAICVVPASVAAAALSYRFVEVPAIRLGKRASAKIVELFGALFARPRLLGS